MTAKRWQDWVNVVLGVWLFASPWVLGYADTAAAWNAYVLGAGIVVFAAIAASMPKVWEEVVNIVLGVWLVLSPFVLGFAQMGAIAVHTAIVGIIVAAFALWAMMRDEDFAKRWHKIRSA